MHDSAGIVTTQAVGASQDFWDLLKSRISFLEARLYAALRASRGRTLFECSLETYGGLVWKILNILSWECFFLATAIKPETFLENSSREKCQMVKRLRSIGFLVSKTRESLVISTQWKLMAIRNATINLETPTGLLSNKRRLRCLGIKCHWSIWNPNGSLNKIDEAWHLCGLQSVNNKNSVGRFHRCRNSGCQKDARFRIFF